jgi:hypothetical protein
MARTREALTEEGIVESKSMPYELFDELKASVEEGAQLLLFVETMEEWLAKCKNCGN